MAKLYLSDNGLLHSYKPLRVVSFDIYYREGSDRVVHCQVSTFETTGRKLVSARKNVAVLVKQNPTHFLTC